MTLYTKCYVDFSGGLSELANDNMADNQLHAAQNIVPGDGFGLARAFGATKVLPQLPGTFANHRAVDLAELTVDGGSTQTLAFTLYEDNGTYQNIYKLSVDGLSWSEVAMAQLPAVDRFIYANKLYWLTGAAYKVYDGTTVSDLAVTPADGVAATELELEIWEKIKASVAVEQRGQRWFYATTDNEVIFSEIGDPALISPTNIVNVVSKDNDTITTLKEYNDGLLIFKRRSVFYLSGWDLAGGGDVTLTRLNVTSGTAFPKTVRLLESGIVYLGANGVYRLYVPGYSVVVAAENVSEHRINKALATEGGVAEAFAEAWDNTYFLSVRGAAAGALWREYRYYPSTGAFFGPYTQRAHSYAILVDNRLYLGLANGYIAYYDKESCSYVDSETGQADAIPIYAVTKDFDVAGIMVQDIKLKKVLLATRQYLEQSSHLTLHIKADYAERQYDIDTAGLDESLVYGEGEYGAAYWGWKDTVTKQIIINEKAKRVTVYLSDAHAGEPLLVYGIALMYKKRKVKGADAGIDRTAVAYD